MESVNIQGHTKDGMYTAGKAIEDKASVAKKTISSWF